MESLCILNHMTQNKIHKQCVVFYRYFVGHSLGFRWGLVTDDAQFTWHTTKISLIFLEKTCLISGMFYANHILCVSMAQHLLITRNYSGIFCWDTCHLELELVNSRNSVGYFFRCFLSPVDLCHLLLFGLRFIAFVSNVVIGFGTWLSVMPHAYVRNSTRIRRKKKTNRF